MLISGALSTASSWRRELVFLIIFYQNVLVSEAVGFKLAERYSCCNFCDYKAVLDTSIRIQQIVVNLVTRRSLPLDSSSSVLPDASSMVILEKYTLLRPPGA